MATYSELGQKAKAKYPQYASMSDDEVGQKLADKYPEYKSQITEPKESGLMSKFTSGIKKVGEVVTPALSKISKQVGTGLGLRSKSQREAETSISQAEDMNRRMTEAIKRETDPKKRELLIKTARESGARIGDISQQLSTGAEETIGLKRGEEITPYWKQGLAAGAEAGSLLLPSTKEAKGLATAAKGVKGLAGAGTRVAEAAGTAGVQGALRGVSEATMEDQSLKEGAGTIAKTAGKAAATGAVLQTGLEGIGALSKSLSGLTGQARQKAIDVYKGTLKENKSALKAIARQGGPDKMIKKANALKLPLKKNDLDKALRKYGPEFNKKVNRALEGNASAAGKSVDYKSMLDKIKRELKYLDRPGKRNEYKQAIAYVDDALETYGRQKANVVSANKLRQSIDLDVGDIPFGEARGQKEAMKMFAGQLRNTVKSSVPETKQYFNKYSLMSDLLETMQKEPKLSLPELMGAFSAGTLGGLGAGGVGGLVTGVGGLLGTKAIRSPGVKRGISRQLQRVTPTQGVTPQVPSLMRSFIPTVGQ